MYCGNIIRVTLVKSDIDFVKNVLFKDEDSSRSFNVENGVNW